jgi:type VI secretion system protein
MGKIRLLERIKYLGSNTRKRVADDKSENDKISIIKYVNKLLNIKEGSLITDKSLGMPDFADFVYNYPECIRDIKNAVISIIEKYEIRLKDVKVDFVSKQEGSFTLRFQITASMADNEDVIIFDSVIDKSGSILN